MIIQQNLFTKQDYFNDYCINIVEKGSGIRPKTLA